MRDVVASPPDTSEARSRGEPTPSLRRGACCRPDAGRRRANRGGAMRTGPLLDTRARRRLAGFSLFAALAGTGIVVSAGPAAASGVTVSARSTALGLVLTGSSGRTVYLFS